jgi:hypothetical protein
MLSWGFNRMALRLLDQHDVARAHIAAPHVLEAWETRGVRYWRSAFLSPFVGAIVPLVGCVVLGWTPGLVLLALTVDVATLWLGEVMKTLLARSRVDEERAHHHEAGDVLAVIHALERPRLPTHRDLLAQAPTPRRRLYVSALPSTMHDPSDRPGFIGITLLWVGLFALLVAMTQPELAPWLLASAALRLSVSVLRTLRARRDPGPRPELLSEAGIPTAALLLALYPSVLLMMKLSIDIGTIGRQNLALLLLGLHLLVAGGLATLGLRRIRRATTELRAFVARDLEQLNQRVRQING